MAEFFVMRRYHRRGVGTAVANRLFALHRGAWEVRERSGNHDAIAFWRRVIGDYTRDNFREAVLDDERWRGPVQNFES
jgi:predicted acetyltransferase